MSAVRAAWAVFLVGALLTLACVDGLAQVATEAEKAGAVASAAQTAAVNWNTIVLAVIGLLSSTVTTVAGIYLAKMKYATDRALKAATSTAAHVDGIHTAVNSERKETLAKLDAATAAAEAMRQEIRTLQAELRAAFNQKAEAEQKLEAEKQKPHT